MLAKPTRRTRTRFHTSVHYPPLKLYGSPALCLALALLPALEKVGNIGASALSELSVLATANTVEVVGKVEVVEQRVAIDGELDRRPCFALLNLLGRLYSTGD
jgi:hypothetical protein